MNVKRFADALGVSAGIIVGLFVGFVIVFCFCCLSALLLSASGEAIEQEFDRTVATYATKDLPPTPTATRVVQPTPTENN